MNSPKHHVKAAEDGKNDSTKKLKEIPMLNMFLKTLQPQYYQEKTETETESSSNTEVER